MADPPDPHRDLAGVLHDVSNALTVLLGWVGEARAPTTTPEDVAYALTIIEQRARVARDLARHAIGAPRIDEQRELAVVVRETIETLKVEAQRKGITLVLHVADAVGQARASGALDVSQVVTNLVLNAIAYAREGGNVEVAILVDPGGACILQVSDDGPGIPADRRESIFHGDSTRAGGTGVGLRHSRALARAWGGDIRVVDSERGARIEVSWPRADVLPRPPTSSLRIKDLENQRLLLIEDDAMVTQLLETVLEARGAIVSIATNPKEVASALASGPYDAILVDLSPLGADPTAAIARIRQSSPDAQLVLVTGQADALPADIDAESVHLVRKPFEVSEVLAVLRR